MKSRALHSDDKGIELFEEAIMSFSEKSYELNSKSGQIYIEEEGQELSGILGSLKKIALSVGECMPNLNTTSGIDFGDIGSDDDFEDDIEYTNNELKESGAQNNENAKIFSDSALLKLRKRMRYYGIGVYIIPMGDEHMSEYTSSHDKRITHISGFTGSAGTCIVTLDDQDLLTGSAALSTDGRYFLQAEKELDLKSWTIIKQGVESYPSWQEYSMTKAVNNNFRKVLSCNSRLLSLSIGESIEKSRILEFQSRFEFRPMFDIDLVDEIWKSDRPSRPLDPIWYYPIKYSGQSANDKITLIRKELQRKKRTHIVVSSLDEVAWILNLRSNDIPYLPVFFAYLIISIDCVSLYVNKYKIEVGNETLKSYLKEIRDLEINSYETFYDDLSKLKSTLASPEVSLILPSKSLTSYGLYSALGMSYAKESTLFESIAAKLRSVKNPTESLNFEQAQNKDSLVFILFASWLEDQLIRKNKIISEYDAACKIYSIRSRFPNFMGLSYESISSTGANAAIIHYAPTKENNSIIDPKEVYLLDSGAQFLEGTTDITRTFKFGYEGLTEEIKKYYTLVLKSHLAVAMAKFPINSQVSSNLDHLARQPLWNEGLDFQHGTGHGVGNFGNVHEYPLYISPGIDQSLFKSGIVVTDEPGLYFEGRYGFRIESELQLIELADELGHARDGSNFYGFKYLTKVPFCRKMIDTNLLSSQEKLWINNYHLSIREFYSESLLHFGQKRAFKWMMKETELL